MRSSRAIVVAGLLAAAGVGAFLLLRGGSEPSRHGSALLVGDSLNLGIEPYLGRALRGWTIRADDVVGRSTAAGLAAFARHRAAPGPLVVSLGTNDDPRNAAAFRSEVADLLDRAGPDRCVIWATLWRNGRPEAILNGVLEAAARERPNLRLLDWAAMLADHPGWRAPDGTHGSEPGYQARAEEAARLVRACPTAG